MLPQAPWVRNKSTPDFNKSTCGIDGKQKAFLGSSKFSRASACGPNETSSNGASGASEPRA